MKYLLLILLFLFSIIVSAQKKNSAYQLQIQKASSAIYIDGELNERAWTDAAAADNFFMVLPMDTSHAKVKTEVRMTYDDKNIYVIAVCYLTKQAPYMVESLRRDFTFGKNDNFIFFMSGDLFVHLFSSLHFITNSFGPNKVYAAGGLRYWKDGREVPDVLLGTFDYPEAAAHPPFNLSLRCNFVDGTSGTTYLKLVGSEGSMDITWDSVTLKRNKTTESDDPFFIEQMKKAGTPVSDRKRILPPEEYTFAAEKDYLGGPYDHFVNFFNAIRKGGTVTEDATFGYRAAAPALLCNDSYNQDTAILWNPEQMQLVKK